MDDYMDGMSYEDWLFEQDWNDVTGGDYTFDEISNNVDVQDLYTASQSDPGIMDTILGYAKQYGGEALKSLSSAFTKPGGGTDWGKVAGVAGGLYGLYQSNRPQEKTGYQGGIPKYEAIREGVAGSQYDPERRPGSGGQRYFSDVRYAKEGEGEAARTAAREEAAGLATLNRENPARGARSATAAAVDRAAESSEVQEGRPAAEVIQDKPVPKYAQGGIAMLAKGGAPRYLGGATDGMADKIPARIDDNQEAKLSHGEFVIPADVVSHLGNGNSEAGAERLYAMMDKIRKARTGTTKQGKQINPDKFLAA
jgi:hypothetical protein